MSIFDRISFLADDIGNVVNGAIGAVVCGAADMADTVSYRGGQIAKDITTPVTTRVESLVDSIKP